MKQENQYVAVVPTRDGTPLLVNGGAVLSVRRVRRTATESLGRTAAMDVWRVETVKGILELHRVLGTSGERDRWLLARPEA